MEKFRITFLFGICIHMIYSSQVTIELEEVALNADSLGCRVHYRGKASNSQAVWIFPREYLVIDFCLSSSQNVSIQKIGYSNDGGGDVLTVFLDDIAMGQIATMVRFNGGLYWDNFFYSKQIGEQTVLGPGQHKLIMNLTLSDRFGIELDSLVLGFDGNVRAKDIQCASSKGAWGGNSFIERTCDPPDVWPVVSTVSNASVVAAPNNHGQVIDSGQTDQSTTSPSTETKQDNGSSSGVPGVSSLSQQTPVTTTTLPATLTAEVTSSATQLTNDQSGARAGSPSRNPSMPERTTAPRGRPTRPVRPVIAAAAPRDPPSEPTETSASEAPPRTTIKSLITSSVEVTALPDTGTVMAPGEPLAPDLAVASMEEDGGCQLHSSAPLHSNLRNKLSNLIIVLSMLAVAS